MSGTGITFTGVIGVGVVVPTDVDTISRSNAETSGSASATLPGSGQPAVAARVGDPMVACLFAGAWNGSGTLTLIPATGWTAVYHSTDFALYTRTADASDVANTASYTWTFTNSAGSTGLVVTHLSWGRHFGSTIGGPGIELTAGTDASVASPGGNWQLAVIGQRTGSPFPKSEPDQMFVTSTAELVHDAAGDARGGNMKVYISDNASPVGATFEDLGSFNACGLMVVPVSI